MDIEQVKIAFKKWEKSYGITVIVFLVVGLFAVTKYPTWRETIFMVEGLAIGSWGTMRAVNRRLK